MLFRSSPDFLERAEELILTLQKRSPDDIRELMGVSQAIAELTHRRVMSWQRDFRRADARQSILAFKGDVYTGLDAGSLNSRDLEFAQKHLRILSGLYGLLRPLDLMQPYRLEMGTRLQVNGADNLYQFWGSDITDAINTQLGASRSRVLINLASNEYFKSVQPRQLDAEIITPVFKDLKNGRYKVLSFFAKRARGMMARHIIEQRLRTPEGLKTFSAEGYRYNEEQSSADSWVFTRDQAA